MGCIYSDSNEKCTIDYEELEDEYCVFEDDPDPSVCCSSYESDWVCNGCKLDLNVEECECGEVKND